MQNWDAGDMAEADHKAIMVYCSPSFGGDKDGSSRSESSSEVWLVNHAQSECLHFCSEDSQHYADIASFPGSPR